MRRDDGDRRPRRGRREQRPAGDPLAGGERVRRRLRLGRGPGGRRRRPAEPACPALRRPRRVLDLERGRPGAGAARRRHPPRLPLGRQRRLEYPDDRGHGHRTPGRDAHLLQVSARPRRRRCRTRPPPSSAIRRSTAPRASWSARSTRTCSPAAPARRWRSRPTVCWAATLAPSWPDGGPGAGDTISIASGMEGDQFFPGARYTPADTEMLLRAVYPVSGSSPTVFQQHLLRRAERRGGVGDGDEPVGGVSRRGSGAGEPEGPGDHAGGAGLDGPALRQHRRPGGTCLSGGDAVRAEAPLDEGHRAIPPDQHHGRRSSAVLGAGDERRREQPLPGETDPGARQRVIRNLGACRTAGRRGRRRDRPRGRRAARRARSCRRSPWATAYRAGDC